MHLQQLFSYTLFYCFAFGVNFVSTMLFLNRTLVYDIQYVPKDDSFRTTNKVSNKNNFILLKCGRISFYIQGVPYKRSEKYCRSDPGAILILLRLKFRKL